MYRKFAINLMHSSVKSLEMDSPKECRICQSTENELLEEERDVNPMVSPCDCNGSLKYVHKKCVIEWMRTSSQLICGVCRTQYNAFPFVRNGLSFGRFLADDSKHRLILSLHAIVSLVYFAYLNNIKPKFY